MIQIRSQIVKSSSPESEVEPEELLLPLPQWEPEAVEEPEVPEVELWSLSQ